MALAGLAIAAALAVAKDEFIDQPAANRKRKYEAATAAYSPWTHMQSQFVQDPNVGNAILGGAGFGAAVGSQVARSNADTDLEDSAAGALQTSSDPSVNSLGGQDMSNQLGAQASNFSASQPAAAPPSAADSNWKFTDTPPDTQPYSQQGIPATDPNATPSWVKLANGNSIQNYNPAYNSLYDAGQSPNNPQSYWQINPFKPGTY